ncbi:MAG TPA: pirin family protein [Acidimicrobiales bacterium]
MSESELVVTDARAALVGELSVRRALPTRGRRTVGAWCFIDHMGPATLSPDNLFGVAPHPHIGLQTVTWLFDGALVHRDSLGSEQLIRPGQLNLMTSGAGIVHSEENPGLTSGELHGAQLWVALPTKTRDGVAAFAHHTDLPRFELTNGEGVVLVGSINDVRSPARHDSDLVGLELTLRPGQNVIPLEPTFEYAMVVIRGAVGVKGETIKPGHLAYLGLGRDEINVSTTENSVALLLGGVPFEESIVMWWNFVARSQEEISSAYESWAKSDERFGPVDSKLSRIEVGAPPWFRSNR